MKNRCFVLNLVCSSSKSLNLLYIQQISPQFIYFISLSTCGEFQICGEFYISYSTNPYGRKVEKLTVVIEKMTKKKFSAT